ncbi:MAG: DUF2075 domain-containing protein [Terriglobales bacterium]
MADLASATALLPRAWYRATVEEFCAEPESSVLGKLVANASLDVSAEQRDAWVQEIAVLREALAGIEGMLLLEFSIPRMGHRADAVLLLREAVVVLEFKSAARATRAGLDQVWDYALDLKHFHAASHEAAMAPVLVHGGAEEEDADLAAAEDRVLAPVATNAAGLGGLLQRIAAEVHGPEIARDWEQAAYHPTPTIIEAARALYAQHRVEEIAYSEAGGESLRRTAARLLAIVDHACRERRKVICFVTGVPGAGKTLVGLNLATQPDASHNAVYLSGNGPLVAVLRAALARDRAAREGGRARVDQSIKQFIQDLQHFRDDGLSDQKSPNEHVVIFDEAQRAWTADQLERFMKRWKHRAGFHHSEPEVLLETMNRREDWTTVVALVGSGQEINTGEGGIALWLQQLRRDESLREWEIHLPHQLGGEEFGAAAEMAALRERGGVTWSDDLHLAVSVRSFRAENLSRFVQAVLDLEAGQAQQELAKLAGRYPVVLSRDLEAAKRWVRRKARANERYGLLASSRGLRLKPHAVDVRVKTDPVHWFLNDRDDIRSSFYLEDAATEYDVQGLELDWACVTWDGDLRVRDGGWAHHDFRGTSWVNVHDKDKRTYIRNAYRVLLTRARQGMAIFIPPGDAGDPTRQPEYYDATFQYLSDLGLPQLA